MSQNLKEELTFVVQGYHPGWGLGGGVGGIGPSRVPLTAPDSCFVGVQALWSQQVPFWIPALWKVQQAQP